MAQRSVLNPAYRKYARPTLRPELRRKQRSRLNFAPIFEWGDVFESWSRQFVRRQFWRVQATFITEEDALQECAAVFIHCRNKYAGRIREPRHMMSLYQTALTRTWNSLSARDPGYRTSEFNPDLHTHNESEEGGGMLAVLFAQCDSELRDLTLAIVNAPAELLAIVFRDNDTSMITRRLSRMFRIKAGKRDLVAELHDLLNPATHSDRVQHMIDFTRMLVMEREMK